MATTTKTLTPTNQQITLPDMTERPNNGVQVDSIGKLADAVNALNSDIEKRVVQGTISSLQTETITPYQSGAHLLFIIRNDLHFGVMYEWWTANYFVMFGTIPSDVVISHVAQSHNITVTNNRSGAIAYICI